MAVNAIQNDREYIRSTSVRNKNRFVAAIAGQAGLMIILVMIAFLFVGQPIVQRGMIFIQRAFYIHLIGSLSAMCIPFVTAWLERKETWNTNLIDWSIWLLVSLDVDLLLFLVCQERGLARSMFLPVFVLIPVAYLAVENPEKRHRSLGVLGMIVSGIIISYYLSDRATFSLIGLLPTYIIYLLLLFLVRNQKYTRRQRFLIGLVIVTAATTLPYFLKDNGFYERMHLSKVSHGLSITTTSFHTDSPSSFSTAIFIVSMLTVFIPIVQLLIILFQHRDINSSVTGTRGAIQAGTPSAQTAPTGSDQ